MSDIIVVLPKQYREAAAQEAADCIADGGGEYFRRFAFKPQTWKGGERVFYWEDGFVRGFFNGTRGPIYRAEGEECQTTGKIWQSGWYIYMDAKSWYWIKPIPMAGFRGIRYFDQPIQIIGGWLDPMPETPQAVAL